MAIEHLDPDCAGRWERDRSHRRGPWRCSICGAEHVETHLTGIAAVRENLLGTLLRLLESDGRARIRDRD